jgi:hypothetical protein
MKTPARLQSLQDEGFIDGVSRQLMSGKNAKHRCRQVTAARAGAFSDSISADEHAQRVPEWSLSVCPELD